MMIMRLAKHRREVMGELMLIGVLSLLIPHLDSTCTKRMLQCWAFEFNSASETIGAHVMVMSRY